ncbi:unnamed protein product, partial [Ectocarpus sp. 8 AP-2014]
DRRIGLLVLSDTADRDRGALALGPFHVLGIVAHAPRSVRAGRGTASGGDGIPAGGGDIRKGLVAGVAGSRPAAAAAVARPRRTKPTHSCRRRHSAIITIISLHVLA